MFRHGPDGPSQDHPAVLRGENGRGPHGAVGLGSRHAQPAAGRDPGGTGHRYIVVVSMSFRGRDKGTGIGI